MSHMVKLEILWTILPIIVLVCIALPSLSMLYYFSLNFEPAYVINVVGHQWYWSYEYIANLPEPKCKSIKLLDPKSYYTEITTAYIFSALLTEKVIREIAIHYAKQEWNFEFKVLGIMSVHQSNLDLKWHLFQTAKDDSLEAYLKKWIEYDLENKWSKICISFSTPCEKIIYDSIMKLPEDLPYSGFRLLEVDHPLFLPVDVPIKIFLSSDDVLHSWAVPSLGIKVDCVPGRINTVEIKIARRGIFYGQCSEICGTQHGFMPICIVALPKHYFF
jgi:heme/copper-type cytochrome/quinol oxidase subunit 2